MRSETKKRSPRTRSVSTIVASLLMLGSFASASGVSSRPGQVIERVSVASDGSQTEGDAAPAWDYWRRQVTMSANSRFVAFASSSSDLVPGEASPLDPALGDILNVYLHDRKTGNTRLVSGTFRGNLPSLPPLGALGSYRPVISADGRFIAFTSDVSNLVEFDANSASDVFVYDRKTKELDRVSVASDGSETELGSDSGPGVSISGDGRYVVFQSKAGNLTSQPISGCFVDAAGIRKGPCNANIYVHDRSNGETSLISSGLDGEAADSDSTAPAISRSGQFIAFDSYAGNLTSNDTNVCPPPRQLGAGMSCLDVFLFDRETKKTELVSVGIDGTSGLAGTAGGGGWDDPMRVSEDGRYVYFKGGNTRTDLVPNDPDGDDAFVRDRKLDRTYRVSVTSDGEDSEVGSSLGMDSSGRYFHVGAILKNEQAGSYIYDFRTGALEPIFTGDNYRELEAEGRYPPAPELRPSYSGRELIFWSKDPLVPDDTNGNFDVFIYDRGLPVGTGPLGGPPPKGQDPPPDDRICVTPDLCIPPAAAVSSPDEVDDLNDVMTQQGANLHGASLAYRPPSKDLFAAIELEHMPTVIPGLSPIFYGLRFDVKDKSYEVRATSFLGGTFGLFDCTDSLACTTVADLRGGYGTTGERVVFSLPLAEIGLENGGQLSDIEAFSAIGSYLTGATKVLDTVRIR